LRPQYTRTAGRRQPVTAAGLPEADYCFVQLPFPLIVLPFSVQLDAIVMPLGVTCQTSCSRVGSAGQLAVYVIVIAVSAAWAVEAP